MTEQEYLSDNNAEYLSQENRDNLKDINAKNKYGLSNNQLRTLIGKHRRTRMNADFYTMAMIEYRLTDINFHSECGLLYKGEYKKAIEQCEKIFQKEEK